MLEDSSYKARQRTDTKCSISEGKKDGSGYNFPYCNTHINTVLFILVFSFNCDCSKQFSCRSKSEMSHDLFQTSATCLPFKNLGEEEANKQFTNKKLIGIVNDYSFAFLFSGSFQKAVAAVLTCSVEALNGCGTPQISPLGSCTSNGARTNIWAQKLQLCKLSSDPLSFQGTTPRDPVPAEDSAKTSSHCCNTAWRFVCVQILIPEELWKALRGGILPGFRYPQMSVSNSSMSWWRGRGTFRVQCFRKRYLKIVSCTDIHVEA